MSDVGRYRKIYTRLWLHPGFNALNDHEKVVAFYLLTGPQTNRIGLYRLSAATAAEDLETSVGAFRKRLVMVCTSLGWLYDAKARVFYIPSFLKWNPPVNVNVANGITNDLCDLPPCAFIDAFAANIEGIPEAFREAFLKGLRLHMPHGVPNQDQDLESHQEPPALRAVALKKSKETTKTNNLPDVDNRVIRIAEEVIKDGPRHAETDYLIDALQLACRQRSIDVTRTQALMALAASQQGLSA